MRYALGSAEREQQRLDRQAAQIAPATQLLLRAAGIGPGMRVLDLGAGLGHVSLMVGEMVGPAGSVVALERDPAMLAAAEGRAQAAGATNVSFVEADALVWHAHDQFDAVVTRLLLFHLPDPVAAVRHHLDALRPGGTFVAIDFDVAAARTEPSVRIIEDCMEWILRAFRAGGMHPTIGTRLGPILTEAGAGDVTWLGIQGYLEPGHPGGPPMVAGIVGTLSPIMFNAGIVTPEELDLDTLEERIAGELADAGAAVLPPTVVGAWGQRA